MTTLIRQAWLLGSQGKAVDCQGAAALTIEGAGTHITLMLRTNTALLPTIRNGEKERADTGRRT